MAAGSTIARIAGSTLAGGLGFFVGFYGGFFLFLSIWGLEVDHIPFVIVTGGIGTLVAGVAIALTVSGARKKIAFLTTVVLGVAMVALLLLLDTDVGGMAVAAFLLVVVTSTLVRMGIVDGLSG